MPEGKKTHTGMTNFFNSTQSHGSGASIADSSDGSDWVSVSNYGSGTNNRLQFGAQNANPNSGDYIRILVIPTTNNDPVARNDVGHVAEDGTLQVDNGDNANVSGSYDAAGEHSGDVLQTSSGTHQDTDADSDTLTVTAIRTGSVEGSGTSGSVGSALTGSYGQLTLNSNGSYTYAANQSAADALDVGDTVTDVFNYTVSDGNGGTDIATITITIHGANDAPVAADNTATVNEDDTITVTDGETAQTQTYEVNDTIDSSTSLTVGSGTHGSGISFSHDGKKMFKTDYEIDQIHQWTLSTAFDPTSKSGSPTSASLDFDVSDSQRGDWPVGHAWNSDGTKLFVVNWDGVDEYWIHSYDLSTAYDVSTISLVSPSASNSYNTGLYNVKSLAVSSDGTKFYFLEDNARQVRQITFATAYDVSSSASSATLSISSDTTYPRSLAFSDNGKKLFVGDTSNEKIHQYNLTTAWDISSGVSYDGGITLTTTIDPFGIVFTDGGTKMLILDEAGETVDVHSLKSPFNLIDIDDEHDGDVLLDDTDADTSASLTVSAIRTGSVEGSGTSGSVGSALTGTYGQLTIAANGSYTYVANQSAADALDPGDIVTDSFNYTVSDGTATDTAVITITVIGVNDAPTAVADTDSVNAGSTVTDTTNGAGTLVSDDTDPDTSSSLYVTKITHTNGNTSNVTYNSTKTSGAATIVGAKGTLTFGSDGSYSYAANSDASSGDDVFTYTLSDGTSTTTSTLTITINNNAPVAANNTGTILEDSTLTVNDGDGANSSGGVTDDGQTADISNEETSVTGLSFNSDGTKMFVSGGQSDTIHEYSLSTAFDVSTKSATADNSYSNSSNYDWTRGHTWNADGTKLFVIDNEEGTHQKILEYSVATGFDLSSTVSLTTNYDLVAPSGGSIPTRPKGITFNSDGTKMYIADHQTDKIHQFTLSVGYNLASTVANSGTLDVSSQNDSPYGVEFSQDGSKVFVVGNGTQGDAVYQYTLDTAWDITSTATYNGSFDLSSQDTVPADIRFNNDGTKMFIAGSTGNEIDEYTLSTPFEIVTISGNHDGDVLVDDSDADSDALSVTTYSHTSATNESGGSASSGTGSSGTAGSDAVTGYYGTLTLAANGSYTYAATATVTDALDPGDVVTDVFTYTVSDGNGGTDTATITITINGINDAPVADNETGSVNASQTLTVTDGSSDLLDGDTDADTGASLSVSSIVATTASGSATAVNPGTAYNSGYTEVTGSYGTLRVGADGTYRYVAGSSAGTDVFTYTLSDGTATDTATLTITVNAVPVAQDDTGTVNEDATLTVSNSSNATDVDTATFSSSDSYSHGYGDTTGVVFNDDGTKVYFSDQMIDIYINVIFQLPLMYQAQQVVLLVYL